MRPTAQVVGHIREFIRARHFGNVEEAGNQQMWLKSKLRKSYSAVLMKHGDPDRGNYMDVMQRWFEEERLLLQDASGR